jgi:hypothetical protein
MIAEGANISASDAAGTPVVEHFQLAHVSAP